MERRGNVYEEFNKILLRNYSPEKLCLLDNAADRMFKDLDYEAAEKMGDNSNHSTKLFDQEEVDLDWDFPDPPDFSRWDCT